MWTVGFIGVELIRIDSNHSYFGINVLSYGLKILFFSGWIIRSMADLKPEWSLGLQDITGCVVTHHLNLLVIAVLAEPLVGWYTTPCHTINPYHYTGTQPNTGEHYSHDSPPY